MSDSPIFPLSEIRISKKGKGRNITILLARDIMNWRPFFPLVTWISLFFWCQQLFCKTIFLTSDIGISHIELVRYLNRLGYRYLVSSDIGIKALQSDIILSNIELRCSMTDIGYRRQYCRCRSPPMLYILKYFRLSVLQYILVTSTFVPWYLCSAVAITVPTNIYRLSWETCMPGPQDIQVLAAAGSSQQDHSRHIANPFHLKKHSLNCAKHCDRNLGQVSRNESRQWTDEQLWVANSPFTLALKTSKRAAEKICEIEFPRVGLAHWWKIWDTSLARESKCRCHTPPQWRLLYVTLK
jgi:hypothetical protein